TSSLMSMQSHGLDLSPYFFFIAHLKIDFAMLNALAAAFDLCPGFVRFGLFTMPRIIARMSSSVTWVTGFFAQPQDNRSRLMACSIMPDERRLGSSEFRPTTC